MYSVILYEHEEIYKESEKASLGKAGYKPYVCCSDEEVWKTLTEHNIDLVIVDTEIGGVPGRGFQFLKALRTRHPNLPVLMTTDKNVDDYICQTMRYGIGNILLKPVETDIFLNIVGKIISKQNIFGLQYYLKDIVAVKKTRIVNSHQIPMATEKALGLIQEWGFGNLDSTTLKLLMQEMLTNALYHSHGYKEAKLKRDQIQLEGDKYIELIYAHNGSKLGISIIDYMGTLTKSKILQAIFDVAEQDRLLKAALESGGDISVSESGRGIDLLRKLSNEYYFNIRRNFMTEIDMIFNLNYEKDDHLSSISILELD